MLVQNRKVRSLGSSGYLGCVIVSVLAFLGSWVLGLGLTEGEHMDSISSWFIVTVLL